MNILIATPDPPTDQAGNETTSTRWARLLRDLGQTTEIVYDYEDASFEPDLLVALHAYKSHAAIEAYLAAHPDRPLVVALTGTDLYKYRSDHPEVDTNIERADALVDLHERATDELAPEARPKTHVIFQSVGRLTVVDALRQKWSAGPDASRSLPDELKDGAFNVIVAAHLRDVKDPLLTARAARLLENDSEIHVHHIGRALDASWEEKANNEERTNARYTWHGEVSRSEALRLVAASALLCSTSTLEGGPNVVGEAIAVGTPVLATEIPGHVGLLGDDYRGYVPVGDEEALAETLERAEHEGRVYRTLREQCHRRLDRFDPARERRAWRELIDSLFDQSAANTTS